MGSKILQGIINIFLIKIENYYLIQSVTNNLWITLYITLLRIYDDPINFNIKPLKTNYLFLLKVEFSQNPKLNL